MLLCARKNYKRLKNNHKMYIMIKNVIMHFGTENEYQRKTTNWDLRCVFACGHNEPVRGGSDKQRAVNYRSLGCAQKNELRFMCFN